MNHRWTLRTLSQGTVSKAGGGGGPASLFSHPFNVRAGRVSEPFWIVLLLRKPVRSPVQAHLTLIRIINETPGVIEAKYSRSTYSGRLWSEAF